jgi:hypothetical protein
VALLKAAALVLLAAAAGCYQPSARDCTVSCQGAGDCLGGQVCGADGWCAAPGVAGTCGSIDHDAATGSDAEPDAVPADAAPPDAASASLHLVVSGRGKVIVEPLGVECVSTNGNPGDCTFPASPGTEVTLLPTDTHPQDTFAAWTTANCEAETGACVITIEAPVTLVGASFQ